MNLCLMHEEVKIRANQLKRQKTEEEKEHDVALDNANQVKIVREIQAQVNTLRRDQNPNVKSFFFYSMFSAEEIGSQSRSANPVADRQNVLARAEADRARRDRQAQGLPEEEEEDEQEEDDDY